jgi:hypothetical protein
MVPDSSWGSTMECIAVQVGGVKEAALTSCTTREEGGGRGGGGGGVE